MAIQTRLVGTLGGARVEITPGLSASNSINTTTTITTIRVPAGETWLAVLSGTLTSGGSGSNTPRLEIGGTSSRIMGGPASVVAEVTGTATVSLVTTLSAASFTGTLYTVKL